MWFLIFCLVGSHWKSRQQLLFRCRYRLGTLINPKQSLWLSQTHRQSRQEGEISKCAAAVQWRQRMYIFGLMSYKKVTVHSFNPVFYSFKWSLLLLHSTCFPHHICMQALLWLYSLWLYHLFTGKDNAAIWRLPFYLARWHNPTWSWSSTCSATMAMVQRRLFTLASCLFAPFWSSARCSLLNIVIMQA